MEGLPEAWLTAISNWAEQEPRIAAVYVYGSRAKDTHRANSDIDLALILTEDPDDTALGHWIFERDRLAQSLQGAIPVRVDLQVALPDDVVVWPAVQEYGSLIYSRS